jgi:hypothetical protein
MPFVDDLVQASADRKATVEFTNGKKPGVRLVARR